ncbi:hypothetical protein ACFX2G_009120 [Malus domestica]
MTLLLTTEISNQTARPVLNDNVSVSDLGSLAAITSSPFCSMSSVPSIHSMRSLPSVKTRPDANKVMEQKKNLNWLVSEGVLPHLIGFVESGSAVCKEKATIQLQSLSIVGHGGVRSPVEICRTAPLPHYRIAIQLELAQR